MLKINELDAALALQRLVGTGRERDPRFHPGPAVVPQNASGKSRQKKGKQLRYYTDPKSGELLVRPKN
ncbi:hypothetical protein KW797_03425 [Candidatus Parcubacteria bacterium]|nr:hypothetical protein [Candidatus Parcubacteria bacterium]